MISSSLLESFAIGYKKNFRIKLSPVSAFIFESKLSCDMGLKLSLHDVKIDVTSKNGAVTDYGQLNWCSFLEF